MVSPSHTTARPATTCGTAAETTWLSTRSASRSNHHNDIWVKITPLSGTRGSSTWSKALIRSVATISSRSSERAYSSRTLPACTRDSPSASA
jgi:hypothetical protein